MTELGSRVWIHVRSALLYHLYSGQLFFSAAILFIAVVAADVFDLLDRRPWIRRVAGILGLLSIALALMSGTPIPLLLAVPLLLAAFAYVFIGFGAKARVRRSLAAIAAVMAIAAVAFEVPHHRSRPLRHRPTDLVVLGDSLSSGGFGELRPWPDVLAGRLQIPMTNLAAPSDDTATALRNQSSRLGKPATAHSTAIVELGGNDMLEGTGARQFEKALDRILQRAAGRQVVMLELPLLPGRWQYGAIQRRLAAKHGVTLVPKRVLAGVLLGEGNTFDGLHLTQQGHDALAAGLAHSLAWGGADPR